jgi:hypothetical protein
MRDTGWRMQHAHELWLARGYATRGSPLNLLKAAEHLPGRARALRPCERVCASWKERRAERCPR